ncbi:MAG: hypothetical protein ACC628_10365 [Pirellulaceae bacterium]
MSTDILTDAGTDRPCPTWFEVTILVVASLTCAISMSRCMAGPDLWGHVQYGRDLLRDGLPAATTYSYTAEGYRWINHENLAEVVLAIGVDRIGPVGMLVAKCLLGVSLIGLMMWSAWKRGVSVLSICMVALLVSINLAYFWSMRPQLLSWVCYSLLLVLLSWCFAGWEGRCLLPWIERRERAGRPLLPLEYSSRRMRFLWLAPVIFFLWANSHGGFVAGWCIFTAYLCVRAWEAWQCRGRAAFGLMRRFAMMIAAAGLATLINPYGPHLHLWLIESLGAPRPEILEWHAPPMLSTVMLPLWLILGTWLAVLLLTRRSRDITHLVILTLTLWQALTHQRHIPFFVIPFGFWMATHVDSVLHRFHITKRVASVVDRMRPALKWSLVGTFCVVYLLLGCRLHGLLRELSVDRKEYPVAAFQYMADHGLQGKMVVTYNWAQYAIAAFGPRDLDDKGIRVSFDGRFRTCYPQQVVDMNFDFVLGNIERRFRGPDSPPFDDGWVLRFADPDLVLVNRHQPHSVNVMFRNGDQWTLLYQDKVAQLWGRAAKYGWAQSKHYVPPAFRRITEEEQEGTDPWPALPVYGRMTGQLAAGAMG